MAVVFTENWSSGDTWEARMSARARAREQALEAAIRGEEPSQPGPDRSTWPVPELVKGTSGRDALLWYFMDGWHRIFGSEPEVVFDHDLGHHVISDGRWQLTFTNLEQFPSEQFPAAEGD